MDKYLFKIIVENAVSKVFNLDRGMSSPAAKDWYDKTIRKVQALPEGDDKRGLLSWLSDFMKSAPSMQYDAARAIDSKLAEINKRKVK